MEHTFIHLSLSVRQALHLKDPQLKGLFRIGGGSALDPGEARNHLMDVLLGGQELLPLSECPGFDPKRGCPGHLIPED